MTFTHLINFFQSSDVVPSPHNAWQLYRLLEYVNVPSRFVGTETQVFPAGVTGDHLFHVPYNRIPTYREPGKINLNTIFSPDVYSCLMDGTQGPNWVDFQRSRQGEYATRPNECPTKYAQPFRSSAGGSLVPSASPIPPETTNPLALDREIEATLLRPHPTINTQPLFEYQGVLDATSTTGFRYVDDPTRNPFFRYQGIQRLENLVTTRSNVYAVWITVGYFEVEPPPGYNEPAGSKRKQDNGTTDWTQAMYDAVYPDGYALGRELGVDTGEIERHRAFYIFDRTLPVGFQRGQDLNVEKTILIKRFIE